tara:strand:- start:3075 stop:3617 length:543 start_codon:yes stop_codon:yes gene_type:complete
MSVLYLDTETNGIGSFRPASQRLVQIAWVFHVPKTHYINDVSEISTTVPHDITVEQCRNEGNSFDLAFTDFYKDFTNASLIVAHNLDFDIGIIKNEMKIRNSNMYNTFKTHLKSKKFQCTMQDGVDICKIKYSEKSRNYKFPKLSELYQHYFETLPNIKQHDALNDCYILKMCHQKMTST